MDWLNDHAGLLVLITAVIIIAMVALAIVILYGIRRKIAVQRLNFLGFYSTNTETREHYANLTIGNRSLNDVGIAELGIRNDKVNFPLIDLYKQKKELSPDARVVIEQRSSISFSLTAEELRRVLIDGEEGKKILKKLSIYAVDLTGIMYRGKVSAVRKLLAELVAADKAQAE